MATSLISKDALLTLLTLERSAWFALETGDDQRDALGMIQETLAEMVQERIADTLGADLKWAWDNGLLNPDAETVREQIVIASNSTRPPYRKAGITHVWDRDGAEYLPLDSSEEEVVTALFRDGYLVASKQGRLILTASGLNLSRELLENDFLG